MSIPFNRPYLTGREIQNIAKALENRHLSGNGDFTKACEKFLETKLQTSRALLVHSCTAALEMAALACDLQPGDEVIMPSFTFVTTASSVALRGAVPVMIDIRPDTLNIDEAKIEEAITPKTKAISVVHYAGVSCEMTKIKKIAESRKLVLIEDAAQGVGASYHGKALGSMGDFGALSFHESKNIVSGEGGALLVNNPDLTLKSEIIREKGTNRTSFLRRETAFYTWMELGSSYVMSEILAAALMSQLEEMDSINRQRLKIWNHYHAAFESLENSGRLRRPIVPTGCEHNGHIYYLLMKNHKEREDLIQYLRENGVGSTFHYIPLHQSPAGKKYCRAHGNLKETLSASERLIRLPVWPELEDANKVIELVQKFLG